MRFLYTFALVIGIILLATSSFAQHLLLPTESLNFGSPSTGTQTFDIVCAPTAKWSVSAPAWISAYHISDTGPQVSGTGPATITVNVQDNESDQPRTDYISVSVYAYMTDTKYVTINQAASTSTTPTTPTLILSTDLINASGGSTAFTFTSDNSWIVTMDSWLRLTNSSSVNTTSGNAGSTNLNVVAEPNPTTSLRIGTITFTSGSVSKTLTVFQDGAAPTPVLTLSTTSINVSGSSSFTFTSDNSWTASMDSWLGLTLNQSNLRTTGTGDITSGNAGTTNLNVVADPNPTTSARTGTITFTSGSVSKTLTVTQDGAALTTDILGGASTNVVDFVVYPNPSDGIVHFKYSNKMNITIYDTNGNILQSFDADVKNTLELNPGLYFIITEDKNGMRTTQKLVVK